jgi:murein DD-endopeptidase MepM/ murein hydrolase activator NlpD
MQTLLGQQSEVAQIQQADAISALYKKKDAEDSLTIQSFYRFPVIAENFKGMSTKFSFFHPGYDIRANYGAEIYPVRDGVIAKVEYETGGYGRYVIVKHENGMETLYAHMSKTDAQVGDTVKMDTVTVLCTPA